MAEATDNPTILYLSGTLPARSETFVYREIFALRDRGVRVITASIHPPDADLGDARLDEMARATVGVYGDGFGAILRDVVLSALRHPLRSIGTLSRGVADALFSRDVRFSRRPKVFYQCLAGIALAWRVRNRAVRHIHAHMAHVPTTIAMYAARLLGVRFSFTGHANDLFPNRTLLREKLERAAFTACISEWHRAFYQQITPLSDECLPIVRCGVPMERFPQRDATSNGSTRLFAVGRLVPKKGFDVLLTALKQLREEDVRPQCKIVGDGPERAALEQQLVTDRLGDQVTLTGQQTNDQVLALMQDADVFVLPCRITDTGDRDGIPVVLMEAMAAGVCAISGDLPAIRELIQHRRNGWLVQPGDVAECAAAIREIVTDVDQRRALAAEGREWVAREFSTAVNAERMQQALMRAVDARN